jgi:hypothetical protein
VLFNGCYLLSQPVQSGHLPTLYNSLVPGLTRLEVGGEYSIQRLLADHAVQMARSDHYNVVILGSSEIWGVTSSPDKTIPAYLDRIGLVAADGRPVSIYNLSFPGPDLLKDLLIWESVREAHLPIDLVILTANNGAFSRDIEHQLLVENGERVQEILSAYNLSSSMLIGTPRPSHTTFWQDRADLVSWFKKQTQAFYWAMTYQDRVLTPLPGPARSEFLRRNEVSPITRSGLLGAFAQSSVQAKIPLIIMAVPIASLNDPFVDWLLIETRQTSLPLLDCTSVLTAPELFEGTVHLMPATHPLFAQILAESLSESRLPSGVVGLPFQLPLDFNHGTNKACSFTPNGLMN